MLHNKQLFNEVPLQSTKYRNKDLCVDNIKTIGDVYCPTWRNEKCVYISAKKTTSFYDCLKWKACCNVFNIPLKDQKPTILLFGGAGTHCFARKTSRDYEKPSPFLKKFLRHLNQAHANLNQEKTNRMQLWSKRIRFLLVDDLSNIFIFSNHFFQFQPTVNQPNLFNLQSTYRKNHDLLSLKGRNP